jgi:predicted enzyme related to lactoylglutathione lyase
MKVRAHPVGAFCWVGLATSDPAAAQDFYTQLFDWEGAVLTAGPAGTFTILRRAGEDAAILYRQTAQARAAAARPHWTTYISVEDAEATAARADDLGGAQVFRAPFDVVDAGRVAAIRDPTGAILSLWQPRARIGATVVNEVGALCWNELATTDVARVKSFFGELVGWSYQTDPAGYTTITNAGRATGGIREQAMDQRDGTPAWLPYFEVKGSEVAARRALQLGARGAAPSTDSPLGRLAVITDPQGAEFAVLEPHRTSEQRADR